MLGNIVSNKGRYGRVSAEELDGFLLENGDNTLITLKDDEYIQKLIPLITPEVNSR